jgi:ankyrin repeat protein
VDVNIADTDGVPALHKAVANSHLEVVRILLKRRDVNINSKNKVKIMSFCFMVFC